jgi:hypothetical protein
MSKLMSKVERANAFSYAMHMAMEQTTCVNPNGGAAWFKLCEELCDPQLCLEFDDDVNPQS